MLTLVFLKTRVDTWDPAYGSGSAIAGVGSVFVIGVGLLVLGAVFMLAWQLRAPAFFRSQTLRRDTPVLTGHDQAGPEHRTRPEKRTHPWTSGTLRTR